MQAECQRQLAAKEAAEKIAASLQAGIAPRTVSFEFAAGDLPAAIPEPEAKHWEGYHLLYSALDALATQEAVAGFTVPVTYDQMKCGLDVPRQLLGDTIWAKAYPAGEATGDTVVTSQLRQLMTISLRQHQAKLVQDKEKYDAACRVAATDMADVMSDFRANKRKAVASPSAGA